MTKKQIDERIDSGELRIPATIYFGVASVVFEDNGKFHEMTYMQSPDDSSLTWACVDEPSGDLVAALGGAEMETYTLNRLGLVDGTPWQNHELAKKVEE